MEELSKNLRELYESEIKERIELNRGGVPYFNSNVLGSYTTYEREKALFDALRIEDKNTRHSVRRGVIDGILYDAIRQANGEVGIKEITDRTDIPLVIEALLHMGRGKGIEGTTREEFLDFNPNVQYPNHLLHYINSIVLLRMVSEQPELVDKLDTASAMYPHHLFTKKKASRKDLEKEIASSISGIITSEEAGLIGKITDYVQKSQDPSGDIWLGKYHMPSNLHFCFADKASTESELDELYNNKETKAFVYGRMLDCMVATKDVFFSEYSNKRFSKWQSRFRVTPKEQSAIAGAIDNFAMNQLLYPWKQGVLVPQTTLSRRLRISAFECDDGLAIKQRTATRKLKKDCPYFNSTKHLPITINCLNRLYQQAKAILEPSTQAVSDSVTT